MSDMNHEYLIKGSPRVLTKVVNEINNFRREYGGPESGRNFKSIIENNDGTLSWSCWEESLMVDLDNVLEGLTQRNATKIWAYHGEENDYYIYGCLFAMEKGKCQEAGFWKADVGFNAAMAAIELEQSASEDTALVLLKELERVCKHADRMSAVLAEMLLTALDRHPSLASNESIWTRVMAIKGQIEASDILSERASNDDELDPNRVRRLMANVEAKILADGLTELAGDACTPKAVRL
jgi:hypothetical protein